MAFFFKLLRFNMKSSHMPRLINLWYLSVLRVTYISTYKLSSVSHIFTRNCRTVKAVSNFCHFQESTTWRLLVETNFSFSKKTFVRMFSHLKWVKHFHASSKRNSWTSTLSQLQQIILHWHNLIYWVQISDLNWRIVKYNQFLNSKSQRKLIF